MDLLNIKEKLSRIRFFIDKVRYKRGRHFYLTIFGLLFLMVTTFIFIFINQQLEIKRKENILKSYYLEENDAGSDKLREIDNDSSEIRIMFNEKGEYLEPSHLKDIEGAKDFSSLQQIRNTIKAYVCGEVKNPGVYETENGTRIIDLLELAGGATENACLEIINLAEVVIDEKQFESLTKRIE